MVSGLPSTQHISSLCSPSGNPSAVHAKESAALRLPRPIPPPRQATRPSSPAPREASLLGRGRFPGQGPGFSVYSATTQMQPSVLPRQVIQSTDIQLQRRSLLSPGRKGGLQPESITGKMSRVNTTSGRMAVVYGKSM